MNKPYWTCPYCESNLDHGEKCDCQTIIPPNTRLAQLHQQLREEDTNETN